MQLNSVNVTQWEKAINETLSEYGKGVKIISSRITAAETPKLAIWVYTDNSGSLPAFKDLPEKFRNTLRTTLEKITQTSLTDEQVSECLAIKDEKYLPVGRIVKGLVREK